MLRFEYLNRCGKYCCYLFNIKECIWGKGIFLKNILHFSKHFRRRVHTHVCQSLVTPALGKELVLVKGFPSHALRPVCGGEEAAAGPGAYRY